MSKGIAESKVVRAALKGVENAQKSYKKWTGGWWLWEAHESLTTVFVAQKLAGLDGAKYVTVEHSAKTAMEDAGAVGRGRLHNKIRANGRFDILLWWGDDAPRVPIEVKCQVVSVSKIKADLQRIEKVVQRKKQDSSFQFGIVVFYTSCRARNNLTAKERLEKRLANISEDCRKLVKNCSVKITSSKIHLDGDSAWLASAIVLKAN